MANSAFLSPFVWRRLHSLMGLWLVLFLMEHLLTNSQAALLLGENAQGFVHMVNGLHNLPYLQAIELFLLGIPIALHGILGIKYLLTSKENAYGMGSKKPLIKTGRNRAYTWQRLTSWFLLFMLIFHVAKFRFWEYPLSVNQGKESFYFVRVSLDNGLYTVADRLGVALYDQAAVEKEQNLLASRSGEEVLVTLGKDFTETPTLDSHKEILLTSAQKYTQQKTYVEKLKEKPLHTGEVIAVAKDFGTATLLTVRDTFKSPLYAALYTLFVLASCFHAFNGLWTFMLTWGVIIKASAQKAAVKWAVALMFLISFLGLAAVWGTYWLNLKT